MDDAHQVVGRLSKLRYELMTNKALVKLDDGLPDCDRWNAYFERITESEGKHTHHCDLYMSWV